MGGEAVFNNFLVDFAFLSPETVSVVLHLAIRIVAHGQVNEHLLKNGISQQNPVRSIEVLRALSELQRRDVLAASPTGVSDIAGATQIRRRRS